MSVHGSEIVLCNRKLSTYINALARAGFVIEQLVEDCDEDTKKAEGDLDLKTKKAKMLPIMKKENFSKPVTLTNKDIGTVGIVLSVDEATGRIAYVSCQNPFAFQMAQRTGSENIPQMI